MLSLKVRRRRMPRPQLRFSARLIPRSSPILDKKVSVVFLVQSSLGRPLFSPPLVGLYSSDCFGRRQLSIRTICPNHCSLHLFIVCLSQAASRLLCLTSSLVTLSCHFIFRIFRKLRCHGGRSSRVFVPRSFSATMFTIHNIVGMSHLDN